MNEHDISTDLERRLEEEAAKLLRHCAQGPGEDRLRTEFGRRRRTRRTQIVAAAAAGLLLLAAAAIQYGRPAFLAANSGHPGETPSRGPETPRGGPSTTRPDKTEGPTVVRPDSLAAYPFVILAGDGDRQRVIAAGVYLPEFVERVDPHDLTPAEREGIRRVLGTKDETSFQPL